MAEEEEVSLYVIRIKSDEPLRRRVVRLGTFDEPLRYAVFETLDAARAELRRLADLFPRDYAETIYEIVVYQEVKP
jgi:hypothetical protein